MIFTIKVNDRIEFSSMPINEKTIGNYCYSPNECCVQIPLIAQKLKTHILYRTILYVDKDRAQVTISKRKLPFVNKFTDEYTCYHPIFENNESEFCQKLRLDLSNRKRITITNPYDDSLILVKPVKWKMPKKTITDTDIENIKKWLDETENETVSTNL